MSQNDQTHFKNLAVFAFWDIMHQSVKDISKNVEAKRHIQLNVILPNT